MMEKTIDIGWAGLGAGFILLAVPLLILAYYRTGLVRAAAVSFIRMGVQLFLAGTYLKYIFKLNSIWLNLGWVLLMVVAAALTINKRGGYLNKYFFMPVFISILANVLANFAIFGFVLVGTGNFFDARYIIPISGMIVGNTLTSSIVGIRSFYGALRREEERYRFYLICGATRGEALRRFTGEALKDAFSPVVASNASMGLIWLPGMMTGQILGGSDPMTAIKYQILIMIAIFIGSILTVFISINMSKLFAFDEREMFRKDVFAK